MLTCEFISLGETRGIEVRLIGKIVTNYEFVYDGDVGRNGDREENDNNRKDDINMLESNTDRSYFMIGAVVVAGIIIAGAVWIFDSQIFGADGILTSTFDGLKTQAESSMGLIPDATKPGANMIIGLGAQMKSLLTTMPLF